MKHLGRLSLWLLILLIQSFPQVEAQTLKDVESFNRKELGYTTVYGDFVQIYIWNPSSVTEGQKFEVEVSLRTTPKNFPYNENTDRSKVPSLPIQGIEVVSGPKLAHSVENNSSGGKTHTSTWTWIVTATSPGVKNIGPAKMTYRGSTIVSNPRQVFVNASPKVELGKVTRYSRPVYSKRSDNRLGIDSIVTTAAYTNVYMSFFPGGASYFSLNPGMYIKDNSTGETYKLKDVNGISPERHMVSGGMDHKFCLVFPPLSEGVGSIDIIEPVENGGFEFNDVVLKERRKVTATADKKGKVITSLRYSPNHKTIELNKYETDYLFTDGMLPLYNSELHSWGFANEQGMLVIPYLYGYNKFETPHFDSGYCIVGEQSTGYLGSIDLKWCIIDKNGNKKALPNIVKASRFVDGFARVIKKVGNSYRETIINTSGAEPFVNLAQIVNGLSPYPAMQEMRPFNDGLSAYYNRAKQSWGFIDKQGRIVIPAIYDEVQDFSEGLAAVLTKTSATEPSRWIFIDTQGKQAFAQKFTKKPFPFSAGRAVVRKKNGDYVMVDRSGEVVSPDYFLLWPCFSNGKSIARINTDYYVLDSDFNRVAKLPLGAGEDFPHVKFKEVNGIYRLSDVAGGDTRAFTTDGERMKYRLGNLSQNLIYMVVDGHDSFVDYDGNLIFSITQSEF